MLNLDPNFLDQIKEAMKRTEGTVQFSYIFNNDDLFDKSIPDKKIFEVVSGKHYFLLKRTKDYSVKFFHSSPGTGTRVATIDLNKVIPSRKIMFFLIWSSKEMSLGIGPQDVVGGELVLANGTVSANQIKVGENGAIYEVGGQNIKTMGIRVRENGKLVLQSTAIESWNETKETIKILHTGTSSEGYIFDILISNLTFPLMVSGFEVYSKKRFFELEQEGVMPDFQKIKDKMRPNKQYKNDHDMVETINFQDFKNECKDCYLYGYNTRFRELGMKNEDLLKIENLFNFRSRIIHTSSLLSMLNESLVPQQSPIFNNKQQSLEYLALLDQFIQKLHKKTLELKRKD